MSCTRWWAVNFSCRQKPKPARSAWNDCMKFDRHFSTITNKVTNNVHVIYMKITWSHPSRNQHPSHKHTHTQGHIITAAAAATTTANAPFPFGCFCFVVLVMRKGGESSWSGPWHLPVHWKFSICTATRTSSYSPVRPSVFLNTGI